MDWFAAIDIYCERVGTAFWAEPLNALSNVSFLIAALWGWREARQRGRLDAMTVTLIALAAMIGIGSFLFHTFANAWSSLADVLPIWSFVALFVLVAMRRVGGVRPGRITVILALVAVVAAVVFAFGGDGSGSQVNASTVPAISDAPALLNGSEQYLPAILALLTFTFITRKRGHDIAPWITAATATFAVSLTFRTLDLHLCAIWPFGTHFLWHLLNGLMIALLFQGLIRSPDRRRMP